MKLEHLNRFWLVINTPYGLKLWDSFNEYIDQEIIRAKNKEDVLKELDEQIDKRKETKMAKTTKKAKGSKKKPKPKYK